MSKVAALLCLTFLTCASAIRTDELIKAVFSQQTEDSISQAFAGLTGRDVVVDKPSEEKNAYVIIKYIVVPSKAKAFIKVVEDTKEAAEKFEGYITYNLVKPVEDNITYIAWAAWKSIGDLVHFLKSEEVEKLIKFTTEEDIVTIVSPVKPVV